MAASSPSGSTSASALLSDPRMLALSSASYVGMFNVAIVSPAIPSIASGLSLPDAQVGFIMAAYTLPGIVFVMVFGTLSDVFGRRRLLVVALSLFGGGGTAVAFVDSFPEMLFFLMIQGVGGAGLQPLVTVLIGETYAGTTGSTAQGVRASVNGVSMLVMPALVGVLVTVTWRYAFLLFSLTGVAIVAVYLLVPEPDVRRNGGTEILATIVATARGTIAEVRGGREGVLIFGGLVRGFAIFAVLTFVPLFADRSLAATSIAIGLVIAMRGVVRILVSPFSGAIVARFSRRRALAGSVLVSAGSVLLMPFAPDIVWLGALVGTYSLGDSIFFPVFMDALTVAATDDHRASVVGAATLFRKVGTTASPVAFALVLAAAGFAPIFLITAGVLVGYAVLVLAYVRG